MDFSYILRSSIYSEENLQNFGFKKEEDSYVIKKNLEDSGFYTVIKINSSSITAAAFDSETDERYVLLDMASANGSFTGNLRMQITHYMQKIQQECFLVTDLYSKYIAYLQETYNCSQDFPWDGDDASVFRCKNNKWFALVMNVSFKSLGFTSEEKVWVVNLKHDAENIPKIIDKKSVFPAYHMVKKYWITVLLTSVTDFEQLCELTARSFELVNKKK